MWGLETGRGVPEKSRRWLEATVVVRGKSKVHQQVWPSSKPVDFRLWWSSISRISMAFCFLHLSYNPVDPNPILFPFCLKRNILFSLFNFLQCLSWSRFTFCSSKEVYSLGNVLEAALGFNRLLPGTMYKKFWREETSSSSKRWKIIWRKSSESHKLFLKRSK